MRFSDTIIIPKKIIQREILLRFLYFIYISRFVSENN